jgi:flagellar basal body-associated protein FliL
MTNKNEKIKKKKLKITITVGLVFLVLLVVLILIGTGQKKEDLNPNNVSSLEELAEQANRDLEDFTPIPTEVSSLEELPEISEEDSQKKVVPSTPSPTNAPPLEDL